ncbi:MAG: polysaccharide biosynthesis/export family protein [Muribaculaceae bacterium]|nr:polysaccharide biosynthesis/export family protein [Muribaculaceae bacterium]
MKKSNFHGIIGLVLLSVALTGCRTPEKIAYFQDTDTNAIIEMAAVKPIIVRPGDKLSIVVKSKDPAISDLFNLPVYSSRIGTSSQTRNDNVQLRTYTGAAGEGIATYTVSPKGDIDFPVLGKLHIEGMSRSELEGYIKGELMGRNLVKDPTVVVDFLSSGVDILGDVKNPGRYDLNKDEITLLEALSLAGDLNVTGQRENVKVIRKEEGKLHTYKVDLTNASEMAKSPVYYLQQGDVVYVEPNEMQKRNSTVNGNNALSVGFWISVASLLTSAVTTIGVFVKK